MIYCELFFIFLILLGTDLSNTIALFWEEMQVLALQLEQILGGFDAPPMEFKYQVSIESRPNFTETFTPVCGGALVGGKFVVSAAHCFINRSGILRERQFSAVTSTKNLNNRSGLRYDIVKIYLPGFERRFDRYNIAVVKLDMEIDFRKFRLFSKLSIPSPQDVFENRLATISGYGLEWILTRINVITGNRERVGGHSRHILKYAHVNILNDTECRNINPAISMDNLLCGLMITDNTGESWGICNGDGGSPLVDNNVLVGIANKNTVQCDDTVKPALYTKVSEFSMFIRNIMEDNVVESNIIVHDNPPHIALLF